MIIFKNGTLSKKEIQEIKSFLLEYVDLHGDAYITKDNLRLFIHDNVDLVLDNIKKGDKVSYSEKGVVLTVGFSDNAKRKYLKVLCNDLLESEKLIQNMLWNLENEVYIKIKKTNPLKKILNKLGFNYLGNRGKEILLVRKGEKNNVSRYKDKDTVVD